MKNTLLVDTRFSLKAFQKAYDVVGDVALSTPLQHNLEWSERYDCNVFLKREDLQPVRSYKLRGAYHKMTKLDQWKKDAGVICASAGNHAQGVAYSCSLLKIYGHIYMPVTTPKQKIDKVRRFGGEWVKVYLEGDSFEQAKESALRVANESNYTFVHPYDDEDVILGQGTVGLELLGQAKFDIDYLFLPVGGGGLAAGVSSVFKLLSPHTKIVGVEPAGAPSTSSSFKRGNNTEVEIKDKFIDGASVAQMGILNFELCYRKLYDVKAVEEGLVCKTMLELYNENAMVVEPAGALSLSVLEYYKEEIKGKNVVCLISGGNNDIMRMEEIKERALLFQGLKHYLVLRFPQRPGALKEFVSEVLGPDDDIVHFEYTRKHNRENGPALVGVELRSDTDWDALKSRLKEKNYKFEYLNEKEDLFQFIT